MKTMIVYTGLSLAALATMPVAGAETRRPFSDKQLAQQQRMTDCSAEATAKAMRGDARRAFMQTCLSAGSVTVELGSEPTATAERTAVQK